MTLIVFLRKLAVMPIRFYQYCISPLFPGCCRFYPTCSAYAGEAILRHGVFKGGLLALGRLLRCHPFCKGGFDPVPASKTTRSPAASGGPGRAATQAASGGCCPVSEMTHKPLSPSWKSKE